MNPSQRGSRPRDELEFARVLLIEEEAHLAFGIAHNLRQRGAHVEVAEHGAEGLERWLGGSFDLIVLDVMLPGLDGFEICRRARAESVTTPVLFLSAKGEVGDRLRGLQAGGDDYLPKPFHLEELLLRVTAILRRTRRGEQRVEGTVEFGGNSVDLEANRARSWAGDEHQLTAREGQILRVLLENEGRVVSRDQILDRVWGYDAYPSKRTIDNFLVSLRKRFEKDPLAPRHFETVRGVGYRFHRS